MTEQYSDSTGPSSTAIRKLVVGKMIAAGFKRRIRKFRPVCHDTAGARVFKGTTIYEIIAATIREFDSPSRGSGKTAVFKAAVQGAGKSYRSRTIAFRLFGVDQPRVSGVTKFDSFK